MQKKDAKEKYVEALQALRDKWGEYIGFHAYLHEGEEHDHTLEEIAIELEKGIITVYGSFQKGKIGKYTKQEMLDEVNKLRKTAPRWGADSALIEWDLLPHHDVLRELELVIAEEQVDLDKSATSNTPKKPKKETKMIQKRFQKWKNPGDACFIIDGDRVKFSYEGKIKDLRIKNYSRAHRLMIVLRTATELKKGEVKKLIGTEKTKPYGAIRDINKLLNDKIAQCGFSNIPRDIEFIGYNEDTSSYMCHISIKGHVDIG